jgi:hypothetical protein
LAQALGNLMMSAALWLQRTAVRAALFAHPMGFTSLASPTKPTHSRFNFTMLRNFAN